MGVDNSAAPDTVLRFMTRRDDVVLSDVGVQQGASQRVDVAVAGCFRLSTSMVSEVPDENQPGFVGDPRVAAVG